MSEQETSRRSIDRRLRLALAERAMCIAEGDSTYWADIALSNASNALAEHELWWSERHDEARQLYAGWGMNQ